MNYKKGLLIVLFIVVCITVFTGCNLPFIGNSVNLTTAVANNPPKDALDAISETENLKIKTVIGDYLTKLYEIPLKECLNDSMNGTINDSIKQFIAKETVEVSEGNPEIRLHYPRIVYINGMLTGGYEILKNINEAGKEVSDCEISYIGKANGVFNYYVKLNLNAKCVIADNLSTFVDKDISPGFISTDDLRKK